MQINPILSPQRDVNLKRDNIKMKYKKREHRNIFKEMLDEQIDKLKEEGK